MRIALSIAGSDPTGGAGLQLDLQVFRSLGVHAAGVATALTVQDTVKVHQVLPAFPSVVTDQLRVLLRDIAPHAIKLGMLATDDVVRAVSLGLEVLPRAPGVAPPLVVDPVLLASDGTPLLERRAWGALQELLGRAALTTPNLPEAEALTGEDCSGHAGVERAGRRIVQELGAQAALVTGGHAKGQPDDCLVLRGARGLEIHWLAGRRIRGGPVHGTGCALAAAITAGLARGEALQAAIEHARAFVARAIEGAFHAGSGARLLRLP